ncbi:MAG TPA: pirin family protein [Nocardioidaceae bacterium]|nr:pirin family protein [Nocardioidaceae bacterium]
MIDVRRAADRFTTTTAGVTTWHSFSFGAHYDPGNVGFAALVAHNEEQVAPRKGYDLHPHSDLEIVTWVLEGSLVHTDSTGRTDELHRGAVQLLSAGSGILHSERNDVPGARTTTRFVQMWLRPDELGRRPSYAQREVPAAGELVPLVSGIRGVDAAVRIGTAGAALHVARLAPGESVDLPEAPRLHVFVAQGAVRLHGAEVLTEGDAVRCHDEGGVLAVADGEAELLVWQLPADPRARPL